MRRGVRGVGKSVARIVVHDSSGELADMTLLLAQLAADRVFLTKARSSSRWRDGSTARRCALRRGLRANGQALPRLEELKAGRTFQSVSLIGQTLGNLVLGLVMSSAAAEGVGARSRRRSRRW